MNLVDELNAVVELFGFEWIRDGRIVDWYLLQCLFMILSFYKLRTCSTVHFHFTSSRPNLQLTWTSGQAAIG